VSIVTMSAGRASRERRTTGDTALVLGEYGGNSCSQSSSSIVGVDDGQLAEAWPESRFQSRSDLDPVPVHCSTGPWRSAGCSSLGGAWGWFGVPDGGMTTTGRYEVELEEDEAGRDILEGLRVGIGMGASPFAVFS
jgi:hypothetical protein